MPECCGGVVLAWQIAAVEAAAAGYDAIEREHILIGLCKMDQAVSPEQSDALEMYFGDVGHLLAERDEVKQWFSGKGIDRTHLRRALRTLLGPGTSQPGEPLPSMHRSAACKRMFDRAAELAGAHGDTDVHGRHLLTVLTDRPTDTIYRAFAAQGLELPRVADEQPEEPPVQGNPVVTRTNAFLARFGTDLTALGRQGKLDSLIGRRQELVQLVRTLSRRSKNNPLLLGDPGVGKTALVRGLALRIAQGKVPDQLKPLRIVELNLASLVAGTKYRGEFEERLTRIVDETRSDPNLVLFLDEIHTMVSAGAAEGAMDAANILKPALSQGDIRCIGSTTVAEYRKYFERDAALARRFQPLNIPEPSGEETLDILRGVRQRYERHHQVTINDSAISAIIELSATYLTDRYFPDKALDVLDESCTLAKFGSVSSLSAQVSTGAVLVTDTIVRRVVSEMAHIPLEKSEENGSVYDNLRHLDTELHDRVIGQDDAIRRVVKVITTAMAGLTNSKKPLGVFLFLGPSGVGKTELARVLAEVLFRTPMIRLDMSEFKEKHSVAKLIGAPPGYVGYEEEGQLTGKLRSRPHSLVLFDEIEKAHPDVFDMFLQLFDEGRLTDSKGRSIDARHCVFVMTSNAVTTLPQQAAHRPIGFAAKDAAIAQQQPGPSPDTLVEILRATFKPEFLNRIDEIIVFNCLDQASLRAIATKLLDELAARLEERGIAIEVGDEVAEFVCDRVSSRGQGARPMSRLIDTLIGAPLGDLLVTHKLSRGDLVEVAVQSGAITLDVRSTRTS